MHSTLDSTARAAQRLRHHCHVHFQPSLLHAIAQGDRSFAAEPVAKCLQCEHRRKRAKMPHMSPRRSPSYSHKCLVRSKSPCAIASPTRRISCAQALARSRPDADTSTLPPRLAHGLRGVLSHHRSIQPASHQRMDALRHARMHQTSTVSRPAPSRLRMLSACPSAVPPEPCLMNP